MGESVQFPMLYYTHNVVGAVNLIEVMRKHNVKNVRAQPTNHLHSCVSPTEESVALLVEFHLSLRATWHDAALVNMYFTMSHLEELFEWLGQAGPFWGCAVQVSYLLALGMHLLRSQFHPHYVKAWPANSKAVKVCACMRSRTVPLAGTSLVLDDGKNSADIEAVSKQ